MLAKQKYLSDEKAIKNLLKYKRFQELKSITLQRSQVTKKNILAMKYYVLKLQSTAFDGWKQFFFRRKRNRQQLKDYADKQNQKIVEKYFELLLDNGIKGVSRTIKANKEFKKRLQEMKRNAFQAWKTYHKAAHKKSELMQSIQLYSQNKTTNLYFRVWVFYTRTKLRKRMLIQRKQLEIMAKLKTRGFLSLKYYWLTKKHINSKFDEIFMKYILKLLRKAFGGWKSECRNPSRSP